MTWMTLYSYSGKRQSSKAYHVKITALERPLRELAHKGFQGFRYVTPKEQKRFEASFARRA